MYTHFLQEMSYMACYWAFSAIESGRSVLGDKVNWDVKMMSAIEPSIKCPLHKGFVMTV